MHDAPILEFDPDDSAVIEPSMLHDVLDDVPRCGVVTWMRDAFERLLDERPHRPCHRFTIETSDRVFHDVELPGGRRVVATLCDIGAPAATALYEVLVAIGCHTIVAAGSSGGLVPELPPGTIVVPDAMIRAEGVSYHYAPAARLAHADPALQRALDEAFTAAGMRTTRGTLWTTDAFFRETSGTVAARVDEGAVAVDMEAAALATVARFRGVRHGHAVYMADTLHGDQWDPTDLVERNTDFRYRVLTVAAHTSARFA